MNFLIDSKKKKPINSGKKLINNIKGFVINDFLQIP